MRALPTIPLTATGPTNSCGLADFEETFKQQLRHHLRAEPTDTIIRDMERACACGQKTIVYAFTLQKVNKLCTTCGAFESKVSIVEGNGERE